MWDTELTPAVAAASSSTAVVMSSTPDASSRPLPQVSSPLKPLWPHIENGSRKERSLFIYPRTNKEIDSKEMIQKLCPSGLGDIAEGEIPQLPKPRNHSHVKFLNYLNKLSTAFRDPSSA
jgi:hypothetical protein